MIIYTTLVFIAVRVSPIQLMGSLGWATPHITNIISVYVTFNLFPFPPGSLVSSLGNRALYGTLQNTTGCLTPLHLSVVCCLLWECPSLSSAWWTPSWPLRTFSWKASMTSLPLPTPTELITWHYIGTLVILLLLPLHCVPGWSPSQLGQQRKYVFFKKCDLSTVD